MTGVGLGILIGCVLYKYLSGIMDIQEEAFGAGYIEGYDDAVQGKDSQFKRS